MDFEKEVNLNCYNMNLQLKNSSYRFSLYNNLFSVKKPDGEIDVNELIEVIKFGYLKYEIEDLRRSVGDNYKYKKTHLPAITVSGIFKERHSDAIEKHNGLMQVDIDNVTDYNELFQSICKDKYTYVCFKSPGGKGIKVIVKIYPAATTHLDQFRAIEKYFKDEFKVEIDTNCKDIARCMLLSYDPEIYCNPFSKLFEKVFKPAKKANKSNSVQNITNNYISTSDKDKKMIAGIIAAAEVYKIDITRKYEDWVKIGFALATTFGEEGREFYHKISSNHPNYKIAETDKQYSGLLLRNNGKTGLGTLIFIAKQYNIMFDI